MSHIRFICLLLILTVASVMDLRMYKVKNGLILMGFILRLILRIIWPSDGMLAAELAGMLLPLLMIGLYKYSMLGAADIKLFSVSGIYLGLNDCLYTILLTFLIAALFALRKLTAKHQLRKRFFQIRLGCLYPLDGADDIGIGNSIYISVHWRIIVWNTGRYAVKQAEKRVKDF